jgi:hypothetical protein
MVLADLHRMRPAMAGSGGHPAVPPPVPLDSTSPEPEDDEPSRIRPGVGTPRGLAPDRGKDDEVTTSQDDHTTIPDATWSRLLAPHSDLIAQPDTLRAALACLDGYTIVIELRELLREAPEHDRRVLEGLAVFLRYIAAKGSGNHEAATTAAAEARETGLRRTDLYDLRRLGALVVGIARGRLPADLHTEATELVRDRLGAPEATRLTALIRRRRDLPWAALRRRARRRGVR